METSELLIYLVVGIVFQYLIIFFAARHANDKLEKKLEEMSEEIRELKSKA